MLPENSLATLCFAPKRQKNRYYPHTSEETRIPCVTKSFPMRATSCECTECQNADPAPIRLGAIGSCSIDKGRRGQRLRTALRPFGEYTKHGDFPASKARCRRFITKPASAARGKLHLWAAACVRILRMAFHIGSHVSIYANDAKHPCFLQIKSSNEL